MLQPAQEPPILPPQLEFYTFFPPPLPEMCLPQSLQHPRDPQTHPNPFPGPSPELQAASKELLFLFFPNLCPRREVRSGASLFPATQAEPVLFQGCKS